MYGDSADLVSPKKSAAKNDTDSAINVDYDESTKSRLPPLTSVEAQPEKKKKKKKDKKHRKNREKRAEQNASYDSDSKITEL